MDNSYSDSILEVDVSRIVQNYKYLCSSTPNSRCAAVVKADAYGLGVKDIAPSLVSAGCDVFFVATLDEAISLRSYIGAGKDIYVFHGVKSGEEQAFIEYDIRPVINDFYQLEIWAKYSISKAVKLPAIIHIDTGMNRLGVSYDEVDQLHGNEYLDKIDVQYFMSHLSCITEEGHPLNAEQVERMRRIKNMFGKPCSLSNSRGVVADNKYHFDLVRPGSMLYGVRGNACHTEIKNVASLKAKIIQIRELKSDSFVGYGAMSAVKKGERIAVVPVGYADGYQRVLSNNSFGYFGQHKVPLVGRVSMDMVIFNISQIPRDEVNIGDYVEIFGDSQRVDEVADRAGTIGYEILTGLGKRCKRVYI